MKTTYRVRIINPGHNYSSNRSILRGPTAATPELAKDGARVVHPGMRLEPGAANALLGLEQSEWRLVGDRLEIERTTLIELEQAPGEWGIPIRGWRT